MSEVLPDNFLLIAALVVGVAVALAVGLLVAVALIGRALYRRRSRPEARHRRPCAASRGLRAVKVRLPRRTPRTDPYTDADVPFAVLALPAPRALEVPPRRDTALHDADTAELVVIDPNAPKDIAA